MQETATAWSRVASGEETVLPLGTVLPATLSAGAREELTTSSCWERQYQLWSRSTGETREACFDEFLRADPRDRYMSIENIRQGELAKMPNASAIVELLQSDSVRFSVERLTSTSLRAKPWVQVSRARMGDFIGAHCDDFDQRFVSVIALIVDEPWLAGAGGALGYRRGDGSIGRLAPEHGAINLLRLGVPRPHWLTKVRGRGSRVSFFAHFQHG